MKPLLFITLLIAISGCVANNKTQLEIELEKERAEALAKIDVAACKKAGGKVEPIGLYELPKCVLYYPDGGKTCKSETDCIGFCVSRETLVAKTPATGICAHSEHDHYGCFSIIENGEAQHPICVD